jgi:protein SCO1
MMAVANDWKVLEMEKSAFAGSVVIMILLSLLVFVMIGGSAQGVGLPTEKGGEAPATIPAPSSAAEDENRVRAQIYDVNLKDQDGNVLSFKNEIVGNRVAVIIPFYTTCTSAYPILVFVFSKLQNMLGERLNRDVVLISITVDPRTDIPIRMKAYSRQQKAKPGWVFLTGKREDLTKVLMGSKILLSEDLESHNHLPVTVVGREGGVWRRFYGFPTPDQLLREIETYLAMERPT